MKATKFFKLAMLGAVIFGLNIGTANAILITGGMGITGNYEADDTTLRLNTAIATIGTGDIGDTVSFFTFGSIQGDGDISYNPFTAVDNVLQIGGWQLDLTTLVIDPNSVTEKLKLSGTGLLTGNGFEATLADWTFSAQNAASYSMTVIAVAEPALVALLALGFIGIGVSQRLRERNKLSL